MENKTELQDKIVFKFDLDAYLLFNLCDYVSSFGLIQSNKALNLAFKTFYNEVSKLMCPKEYERMQHDITDSYGVYVYENIF